MEFMSVTSGRSFLKCFFVLVLSGSQLASELYLPNFRYTNLFIGLYIYISGRTSCTCR